MVKRKLSQSSKAEKTEEVETKVSKTESDHPSRSKGFPARLRASDLVPGTKVLAAVREVTDSNITLTLPFDNVGQVSADEASSASSTIPLKNRFNRGQLLAAVVLEQKNAKTDAGHEQTKLRLSLKPAAVNAGLTASTVLVGTWLAASVQDQDDTGYTLDFGLKKLAGHLPRSAKTGLKVGTIIQVCVHKLADGVAKCNLTPTQIVQGKVSSAEQVRVGSLFNARIAKSFRGGASGKEGPIEGLSVYLGEGLKGAVQTQHLAAAPDNATTSVQGRVLISVPGDEAPTIHLTRLSHLLEMTTDIKSLKNLQHGHRVDACVTSIAGHGAHCSLTKHTQVGAYLPTHLMTDKEDPKSKEQLQKEFAVGTSFEAYLMNVNVLEGSVVLSARKSDVQKATQSAGLKVGEVVDVTITKVQDEGVHVQVTDSTTSFIKRSHLTDAPTDKLPKAVKEGGKLKCRVLRVLQGDSLELTAKPTLVKSTFQLSSMDQVRDKMIVKGFLRKDKAMGVIVQFFGGFFARIAAEELQADEAPPTNASVTVKLDLQDSKGNPKVQATLALEGGKQPEELSSQPAPTKLGAGSTLQPLKAVAVTENGVCVNINKEGLAKNKSRGFILKAHLADDLSESLKMFEEISKKLGGSQMASLALFDPPSKAKTHDLKEEGVVLNPNYTFLASAKDSPVKLMSLKSSLVRAAKAKNFPTGYEQVVEGQKYSAYVKEILDKSVLISVGAWSVGGIIPKSEDTQYQIGQSIFVKVKTCNPEGKRYFANHLRPKPKETKDSEKPDKSEQPKAKKPRVGDGKVIESAEVGEKVNMAVTKVDNLSVFCKAEGYFGLVHATQMVDAKDMKYGTALPTFGALGDLAVGSDIEAKIVKVPERDASKVEAETKKNKEAQTKLILTAKPSLMKDNASKEKVAASRVTWQSLQVGVEVVAGITEVKDDGVWMEVGPEIRGKVKLSDLSTDLAVVQNHRRHFKVGQLYKVRVVNLVKNKQMLDLTCISPDHQVEIGSNAIGVLTKIDLSTTGIIAHFKLPGHAYGSVHVTELADYWVLNPRKALQLNKAYQVAVLKEEIEKETGKDKDRPKGKKQQQQQTPAKHYQISLRDSKVYGRKTSQEEKRLTFDELEVGKIVHGYIVNSTPKGVFVAISPGVTGRLRLKELPEIKIDPAQISKVYPPGMLIKDAKVQEIDPTGKKFELSLLKGVTLDQLSVGDIISGTVTRVERFGIFVRLKGSTVTGLVHTSELGNTKSVTLQSFKEGDRVARAKVIANEKGKLSLSLKPSHFEGLPEPDSEEEEEDDEDAAAEAEAKVTVDSDVSGEDEAPKQGKKRKISENVVVQAVSKPSPKIGKKAAPLEEDADLDEDVAPWEKAAAASGLSGKKGKASAEAGDEAAFVFAGFSKPDEEQDSEEDEDVLGDEDQEGQKPTKRQRKAQKKAEAEEARKAEAEAAQARLNNDPQSASDFERLLLTEGESSIVWIKYMAFHLKMSDLEKAREVAERAVKHVGFSDAQERFNVWVAFMNLECTFGTEESAAAIFGRAAAHNDPEQVHLQMAKIHERNKKPKEAVKAFEVCCKKFPQSKQVWLSFLTFLYSQQDLEGARKTLPKALASLPKADHAMVTSKAGTMEYSMGSAERGRSIFEGLLDSYPKRTDLWSVYLDAHIKANTPPKVAEANLEDIRALMSRCCTLSLKAAKMRFFFKRWLDFEKKWGDEETQEEVREKARAYVESQA